MCVTKLIEYIFPPKIKTYYGIDTRGYKVLIRAKKRPMVEPGKYVVISEDEEYIDNLIKEEEDGYLLCQE